jgi:hypothetical protein
LIISAKIHLYGGEFEEKEIETASAACSAFKP